MYTRDKKVFIVNSLYPLTRLLDIKEGKNIKCLFHDDRKPSVRIYGNSYWCFTCKRFYYVYNIIKLLKIDLDYIFDDLQKIYDGKSIDELYELSLIRNKDFEKDKRKVVLRDKNLKFIDFCKEYFSDEEGVKND